MSEIKQTDRKMMLMSRNTYTQTKVEQEEDIEGHVDL